MSQDIRDKHGKLLARISTRSDGREELRDAYGRLLGTYDPGRDQTRDSHGSLVTSGNALSSLIEPD